jgi:hypothetical protein
MSDVARPAAATRRHLRPWMRKGMLVIHVASAGSWLGIDVAMAVLVFTALFTDDLKTRALSYQALDMFVVWSLFTVGVICLATGIVLGLGSRYGLIRYWWVAIKLVLNLLLTGLVLLLLRGGVAEAAERARHFADDPASLAVGDLIYPPIVSPTALLIAMVLAVFKPWGRIRRAPAR